MSKAPRSTTSRTLSSDSQLIEDFLHTDDILVDGTCDEPVAVFLNQQGDSESMVISKKAKESASCTTPTALSLLLNLASFVAGQNKRLAKYLTVGPQAVAAVGLVQVAGVIAAVEFDRAGSGYNGFNSAGAIIGPIPSIAKLALLTKSENALYALGPVDLICDVGAGLCSFAGDIA